MMKYAEYLEKLENHLIKDEFGNVIHKPNPSVLVKPIINFYNGEKFSGKYRQFLSDLAKLKQGPLHLVVRQAATLMDEGGFRPKKEEGMSSKKKNEEKELPDLNKEVPDLKKELPDLNKEVLDLNKEVPDLNKEVPDLKKQESL